MLEKYINAATRRVKSDLVLKKRNCCGLFSGCIKKGDIAVAGEIILGTG